MPDIRVEPFNAGQDHYRSGGSVFDLAQRMAAGSKSHEPDAEENTFSFLLGFVEALVGDIRALANRTKGDA